MRVARITLATALLAGLLASPAHADITVSTNDPTGVQPDGATTLTATLRGAVIDTAGISHTVTYHFEYGTNLTYGTSVPVADDTASCFTSEGRVSCPASAAVSGLQQATLYHYRLVATVDGGAPIYGNDNFLYGGPPVNQGLPQVTGGTQEGGTLETTQGSWSTTSGSVPVAFQWRRCDAGGDACSDIDGATASTHLLVADDVGTTLRATVTRPDPVWGSTSATSAPSPVITGAPAGLPVNVVAPGITGTPDEGKTLTLVPGQWTASSAITYAYQWRRCTTQCVDIDGATEPTYILRHAEADATIVVVETATTDAGSRAATSAPTGPVVGITPPPPPPPPATTEEQPPPSSGGGGQGAPVTATLRVGDGSGTAIADQQVALDAFGSSGGSPLNFAWDFDHAGTFAEHGPSPSTTHVFTTGAHAVTVRVTDPQGHTATATQNVTVADPTEYIYTQDPPDPEPDEEVRFTIRRVGAIRGTRAAASATAGLKLGAIQRLALNPGSIVMASGLTAARERTIVNGLELTGVTQSSTGDFRARFEHGIHNLVFAVTDNDGTRATLATQIRIGMDKDGEAAAKRVVAVTWNGVPIACTAEDERHGRCQPTTFTDVGKHDADVLSIPPQQIAEPLANRFGGPVIRTPVGRPGAVVRAGSGTFTAGSADLERWEFGDGSGQLDRSHPCPTDRPTRDNVDPWSPTGRFIEHQYRCNDDPTQLTLTVAVERGRLGSGGRTKTGDRDVGEWPISVRHLFCGDLRTAAGFTITQTDGNACWEPLTTGGNAQYATRSGVQINGVTVQPPASGRVQVDLKSGLIAPYGVKTLTATLAAGPDKPTPLGTTSGFNLGKPLDGRFSCPTVVGGMRITRCRLEMSPTGPTTGRFETTLGVKLTGNGFTDPDNHAEIPQSVELVFTTPDGSFRRAGFRKADFYVGPDSTPPLPNLSFGPFSLTDVSLTHETTGEPAWHGGGNATFPIPGYTLQLVGEDSLRTHVGETGFGIGRDGSFQHLGLRLNITGGEGIQLDPMDILHLTGGGIRLQLNPFALQVDAIITARTGLTMDGCFAIRDGAGTQKSVPACLLGDPAGDPVRNSYFNGSEQDKDAKLHIAAAIHEEVDVKISKLVGDARLTYASGQGLHARLSFSQRIFDQLPQVKGMLEGDYWSSDRWSLWASAEVLGGVAGSAVVALSSRGLGACWSPPVIGKLFQIFGGPNVGIGFYATYDGSLVPQLVCTKEGFDPILAGLRAGPSPLQAPSLRSPRQASGVLGAGMESAVTVAKKTPFQVLRVKGVGAAPQVTLSGPGGVKLVDDGQPANGDRRGGFAHLDDKTTMVVLRSPAAGRWTVTSANTPITGIEQQRVSPPAKIKGKLANGNGVKRKLRYEVTVDKGQTVVFTELGGGVPQVLGTVGSGKRTLAFAPTAGGRRHKVIAQVQTNGILGDPKTVATFTPPTPPRPPAPRKLKAKLSGSTLVLRWKRVKDVAGYRLTLKLKSGALIDQRLPANATSFKLAHVTPADTGTAALQSLAKTSAKGRTAKVKLPKPKLKPPRL